MQWTCVFDFKKIFLAISTFMFLCLAAAAQESLITSVAISQPKDLNGAYQLTIKADKPVEYKEKAQSSNSVYFDLKNALTVDNIEIAVQNRVSGIIQPAGSIKDKEVIAAADKYDISMITTGIRHLKH